ncbi:hypothetical protein [Oceanimonas marisflavi]|uniref:hypothetical protein n=1 Tax=Oceanimonas marisflavi TaxID=2059724 RepID=UPI000D3113EF|nr:hypothetical protein [Oceanimonas marisflavi]
MSVNANIKQVMTVATAVFAGGGVPMLWGPPGVGKSIGMAYYCQQRAAELGLQGVAEYGDQPKDPSKWFGFIDLRATDKDPVDMGGLPDKDETTGVMIRLCPDWFPHTGRTDLPDHGVLFIDEAPSAPPSVQVTCYQITQEKRIGAYKLKPGWSVAMAGNRVTDSGASFKMPAPLANRIQHLHVSSDSTYWLNEVASIIELEPLVQAFIRFRPDLLNTFEAHLEHGRKEMAFATERSWQKLSDILKASPRLLDDRVSLMMLTAGTVGEAQAVEFCSFVQIWQDMPDIDQILADPVQAPVEFNAATTYAVLTALAHRAESKTFAAIMAYLTRLSPEYAVAGIKTVNSRDNGREIYATEAFIKWSTEYGHLLG